ncbi:MAG: hypothetical protein JSS07_03675 [Proteobacteria bacterium]|nr:hypothetical protein [Pseudomonadota bacterium]
MAYIYIYLYNPHASLPIEFRSDSSSLVDLDNTPYIILDVNLTFSCPRSLLENRVEEDLKTNSGNNGNYVKNDRFVLSLDQLFILLKKNVKLIFSSVPALSLQQCQDFFKNAYGKIYKFNDMTKLFSYIKTVDYDGSKVSIFYEECKEPLPQPFISNNMQPWQQPLLNTNQNSSAGTSTNPININSSVNTTTIESEKLEFSHLPLSMQAQARTALSKLISNPVGFEIVHTDGTRWVISKPANVSKVKAFSDNTKALIINKIINSKMSNEAKKNYCFALIELNNLTFFQMQLEDFKTTYTKSDIDFIASGLIAPDAAQTKTQTQVDTQTQISTQTQKARICKALRDGKDTINKILTDCLEMVERTAQDNDRFKQILGELREICPGAEVEVIRKNIVNLLLNGKNEQLSAAISDVLDDLIDGLSGGHNQKVLEKAFNIKLSEHSYEIYAIYSNFIENQYTNHPKPMTEKGPKLKIKENKKDEIPSVDDNKVAQNEPNLMRNPPPILHSLKLKTNNNTDNGKEQNLKQPPEDTDKNKEKKKKKKQKLKHSSH